jgi:subtilisin family serine protease
VRYIEADAAMTLQGVGDTTQLFPEGALDRMDQRSLPLNQAYEWSVVGSGVHVWIVDNGINASDTEFASRVSTNPSFTFNGQNSYQPCPTDNHGTLMARAAVGRTVGVARNAILHSARVNETSDCRDISTGAASAALELIADFSPRPAVANLSFSRDCFSIFCGFTVDDAAEYAHDHGVVVVAAAGNGHNLQAQDACGYSPAHVNRILTVSASGYNTDTLPDYANYGGCVDLFAPINDGGGTSTATAYVSGAAALLLQLYPTASPTSVAAAILSNATTGALSGLPSGSPNRLLYSKQPVLSVSIVGPSTVGPDNYCVWNAVLAGGQPPYSVQWKRDGVLVAPGMSYSVSPAGSAGFSLEFFVTDGVGRTQFTTKSVSIDFTDYSFMCSM